MNRPSRNVKYINFFKRKIYLAASGLSYVGSSVSIAACRVLVVACEI